MHALKEFATTKDLSKREEAHKFSEVVTKQLLEETFFLLYGGMKEKDVMSYEVLKQCKSKKGVKY